MHSNQISSYRANDSLELANTIDEIIDNHYFVSKMEEFIERKLRKEGSGTGVAGVQGFIDNQYYSTDEEVVAQISEIMLNICEERCRQILNTEFINVNEEILGMKEEMFKFVEEQHRLTQNLHQEVNRLSEQFKRKSLTVQSMSSTGSAVTYSAGIRFLRSGTQESDTNSKSYHSQLVSIRKEIEELKLSIENGESIKILREESSEFKIETKVCLQSLKQQNKKFAIEIEGMKRNADRQNLNKELIEQVVKRAIKSQIAVYGNYSEQIVEMKGLIDKFENKLILHSELHQQYLSNQLKSLWMVVNDMKRTLDMALDHIELDVSSEMM